MPVHKHRLQCWCQEKSSSWSDAAGVMLLLLSSALLLITRSGLSSCCPCREQPQLVSGTSLTHISSQGLKWGSLGDFTADPDTPKGHRKVNVTKQNTLCGIHIPSIYIYLSYLTSVFITVPSLKCLCACC